VKTQTPHYKSFNLQCDDERDRISLTSLSTMETPAQVFRFGPYESRPRSRELYKHGLRLKVRPQPLQVLNLLLNRAGDVVSREVLREELWSAETFVDFEHSLNTAVKEIRATLGDSPLTPRYIETLPRLGYRFIAPVEVINGISDLVPSPAPSTSNPNENPASVAATIPADIPASEISGEGPRQNQNRHPYLWLAVALAAAGVALAISASLWLRKTEYFWRNPIADARFQTVTDFEGVEEAAAVSRDGHLVAFLSDRDRPMDVWVTQVGSGEFHNLTRGQAPEIANPLLRNLRFSPDGSLITFWGRQRNGSNSGNISVWAVPTLGGQPRPYLEGVAELDWSHDGSRIVYHTPGPGDPMYVSDGSGLSDRPPIFTAPAGLHAHFQLWSPDSKFIYFVQGSLPDKLDIWRITPAGGSSQRITSHAGLVTYPILLDRRTLVYLATDRDGSGPWLYSMDVERRVPHRLTPGPDRYTSVAASADGRRLVVTLTRPKRTLWRLQIADTPTEVSAPTRVALTTGTGFSPRLGPNYLLYVAANGANESIWKLATGAGTELWNGQGAQILGGPALSSDGRYIAFSARQHGKTLLCVMQSDGTNARVVADSLDLQGDPVWAPDGQSITSAANDHGVPRLFRVPLDGHPPARFVQEYSLDPAWAPDGRFVVYSGPDIGTTFSVKAVAADASAHILPPLTLTRGARHIAFLSGGRALVLLRGEIQHKNLWLINLETGAERQLTNLTPDFDIHGFDISPDGRELVLEREQDLADVVLLDLPRP
jgi:Tol biopolymer transport system component/DNA-binding winged helix-turn-helix (wHTH) protein